MQTIGTSTGIDKNCEQGAVCLMINGYPPDGIFQTVGIEIAAEGVAV